MSTLFTLQNVVKSHDGRPLLDGINLAVQTGEKIGVIGRNGAGKSTLLRLLTGEHLPESGQVGMRGGCRIGVLRQNPTFPDETTGRGVLQEVFGELRGLISAYEVAVTAEDGGGDADALLQNIERLGGWDYEHRIDKALSRVGFPSQRLDSRVGSLSGGERKRLALAQLLLGEWDLLLLDEPTNHLDAETVDGLQEWLKQTSATLLLITHDRYFLDAVVERMVEVRGGQLRTYDGNYTDYLVARALEEVHRKQRQHRQLRRLMTELEWARRSPQARSTKSKSRLQRIDLVQQEVKDLAGDHLAAEFHFAASPRLGSTILELDQVEFSFADQPPLMSGVSLGLRRGMRVGIVGPNGAGKSTLLRMIMGEVEPTAGRIVRGKNTQVAYFDQHRTQLDPQQTVREGLVADGGDTVFPPGKKDGQHVASWLDRFGFATEMHHRRVGTLSGGEKNRLAIAQFLLQQANLLILDEPTNDLDIATLNLLEEAIASFDGCVLLVSHDRYMLDKVATGMLAFESEYEFLPRGTVTYCEGGYSAYAAGRMSELRRERQQRLKDERQTQQRTSRQVSQAKTGLSHKEKRELEKIEGRIETADAEVGRLQRCLNDPEVWSEGGARGTELQTQLSAATDVSADLYRRWQELEDQNI